MPIEKSHNPHDHASHKTFHEGSTYNELHGHSDGDGLTCGTFTVRGDPGVAVTNPHGVVGIVTKGTIIFIDSSAPNDRQVFKEGHVFHITKGSTYKWGADPYGEAFYAMPKSIDDEMSEDWKKPDF